MRLLGKTLALASESCDGFCTTSATTEFQLELSPRGDVALVVDYNADFVHTTTASETRAVPTHRKYELRGTALRADAKELTASLRDSDGEERRITCVSAAPAFDPDASKLVWECTVTPSTVGLRRAIEPFLAAETAVTRERWDGYIRAEYWTSPIPRIVPKPPADEGALPVHQLVSSGLP